MADIIKVFYEVGEVYKEKLVENYNESKSKSIEKIVVLDIKTDELGVFDKQAIVDKFFLRVTSPNGGNLFPFLFLSDKLADGIKKAFKNMRLNLQKEQQKELDEMGGAVDYEKIDAIIAEYKSAKNYYFGLMYDGKSFNEIYPQIISNYIDSACSSGITINASCYMGKEGQIGFDAGLNFCSVNELPDKLQKSSKYRLLPLSKEAASSVQQGFEKIFNDSIFRFRLFGLTYYLLPTVFLEDKKIFFDQLQKTANEHKTNLLSKVALEERLEELVEYLDESELSQKALFTFMFAEKNNNEIKLYQTIEDVAPSRIKKAAMSMAEFFIDSSNLSKYIKKTEYKKDSVYIRDYISEDRTSKTLFLAKLIFGKETITDIGKLYNIVNQKILFGNNQLDNTKREFSKILNGYFADDTEFEKHQIVLDFLADIGAIGCNVKNLIYGGDMNELKSFGELMDAKFESVELLKEARAKEFYVVGALARFVMSWQYNEGSDTVEKYINSIGSINTQNIDRVFRKVYDGSRKYNMYGTEFDALLAAYSQIKSQVKQSDNLSIDKANIAFVMGNIDYKNFKSKSKEGEAQ